MKTILIWIGCLFPAALTASPVVKGLWVVRDILKSKSETDKMLSFVEKAGITDVFLQVRGRADAYYKSDIVTRAENLDPGWDPLGYVCEKLKGRAVHVHAWLNVYYLWSADRLPTDSTHLLYRHREWSAVSRSGASMYKEGIEVLKQRGLEGIFLSPANNDFSTYFIDVVVELISRYPIQGIHLDYVRFPSDEYDYSAAIRSKFLLAYHLDPLNIVQDESHRKLWDSFRKEQVSELVKQVYRTIKSRDSLLTLSAAVWADAKMADNVVLQDWSGWLNTGQVDFLVLMNYATDDAVYENRLKEAGRRVGDLTRVISGISLYNQNPDGVKRKLDVSRKYPLRGLSFFSYETIRTEKRYRDLILQTP